MNSLDAVAIFAVLLTAAAVLPGTLGILMLTNKIAASPAGARYIYSQSGALIALALAMLIYSAYRSAEGGEYSTIVAISMALVSVLLIYGFLMHAKMLFKPIRKPLYISIDKALDEFGAEEEVVGRNFPAGQYWLLC